MRLMVVEDEPLIGLVLKDALESDGHVVTGPIASSGEALLWAKPENTDLAIVDVDLESKGAGLKLATRLAELNIGVIFTTGQPDLVRRNCNGAIGLIEKPYLPTTVVDSISVASAIREGKKPPPPLIPKDFQLL